MIAFAPVLCRPSVRPEATVFALPEWRVRRFVTREELEAEWPAVDRADDYWLRAGTLAFQLEHPQGVKTEPLLLENLRDGRRVQLTAQTFYFSAGGQVSDAVKGQTSGFDLRRRLLAPFSFRVLCLGQFLVSGNYASAGLDKLTVEEKAALLPALADALMARCRSYAGAIIKDLFCEDAPEIAALGKGGFHPLATDAQLCVELPAHWCTLEDYLSDLKSKYRVRYRRARAKLGALQRRRIGPGEVGRYREEIYRLYLETAAGSDFNAVALTPEYFPWLSNCAVAAPTLFGGEEATERSDGPQTALHGYFTPGGELVGFTSTIGNGPTLHAHFLGMKESYKTSHHLYHNMLFDLLEEAIAGGYRLLDYARTAPEIKTSVGATAVRPAVLLRVRSGLLNPLVPFFAPAVFRERQWTARNPFRG